MKKYSIQDLWIRIILFFVICVILIFTLQTFVLQTIEEVFNDGERLRETNPTLAVNIVRAMNGIVGIGLVYVFLSFDRQKLSSVGFSWDNKLGREWILISIPIALTGLIFTFILEISLPILFQLDTPIVEFTGILDPIWIIISLFIAFFAFGIGEELLFRGYLQSILETKYSFYFSAIVSALFFGLLHFLLVAPSGDIENMIAILFSAFAIGLVFSYAFKTTKYNLIFPIAIHGVWDFIIFALQSEFTYETLFHTILEIFASIIGAIVIFLLVHQYSSRRLDKLYEE